MKPDSLQAPLLAAELRRRLGPPPESAGWPLVSVIVPSRDGAGLLRRLLVGLVQGTDYPKLELIVVDNASSDDSLRFLRGVPTPFPVSIVANRHNESFADACNQGAERASGALLLFLNNDAEPFESGWLRELVDCLERRLAGAVGPILIEDDAAAVGSHGYAVQQRGLRLREREGLLAPSPLGLHGDPLGEGLGEDTEPLALIAACLLIERRIFEALGGFSSGYWYGPEDVDLSLKLRERGRIPVCCGRSLLIHRHGTTLRTLPPGQRQVSGNRRLFMERWGPRLRREIAIDRLSAGDRWCDPDATSAAPVESHADPGLLGICVKDAMPEGPGAAAPAFEPVRAAIEVMGRRCLLLPGSQVDDLAGLDYDAIVHLRAGRRHIPIPGRLNVLFVLDGEGQLTVEECSHYDLVVGGAGELDRRLPFDATGIAQTVLKGIAPEAIAAQLLAAVESRALEIGLPIKVTPPTVPVAAL